MLCRGTIQVDAAETVEELREDGGVPAGDCEALTVLGRTHCGEPPPISAGDPGTDRGDGLDRLLLWPGRGGSSFWVLVQPPVK